MINSSPALCASDVPCSVGECHDDSICYDSNDKPVPAYIYKINWMVKAPQDDKSTPYKNDQDQTVTYNVEIRGGPQGPVYLYSADCFPLETFQRNVPNDSESTSERSDRTFGSNSTLGLKNGETDKDLYITYSPQQYTETCQRQVRNMSDWICILFEEGPVDIDGYEITKDCTDFAQTTQGNNPFGIDPSDSSSGQPSQRVSDVGRKQI